MPSKATAPFGVLLRRYRQAASLSQAELAARAGLSADAVGTLERGRRYTPHPATVTKLAAALGLTEVERRVFGAAANESMTPANTTAAPAPPLPFAAAPLLGRGRALVTVLDVLRRGDVRLLTLTGPSGVGKTRLALAVATALRDTYGDGATWVDLGPARTPAQVTSAMAQALGVHDIDVGSLHACLRGQHRLLVLDNFEQVLDAAPLVASLVWACPRLTLLVTSRTALRIRAEQRYRVSPFETPAIDQVLTLEDAAGWAAVQLFVARAKAVNPDFALTPGNVAAVGEICRRLDGLPLSIELAAARSDLLPPSALLDRMDQRFTMLTGGAVDLPPRQRSLRAALDWSYNLLPPATQGLLAVLAIFTGGATLAAIEAVIGADAQPPAVASAGPNTVLDGIASLVDASLVRRDEQEGEPHFSMLETVRAYARERLEERGEAPAMHRAHAVYYVTLAETAQPELIGPHQTSRLAQLEQECDNFRVALAWTRAHAETELEMRLVAALWRFWAMSGHAEEGRTWLGAALAATSAGAMTSVETARREALLGAGALALQRADPVAARAYLTERLDLVRPSGDNDAIAVTLMQLGRVANFQGHYEEAGALYQESLALEQAAGNERGIAMAISRVGDANFAQGDHDAAAARYEDSLRIFRRLGDWDQVGILLCLYGRIQAERNETTAAHAAYEESLALNQTIRKPEGMGLAALHLGWLARQQEEDRQAFAWFCESLRHYRNTGAVSRIASCLEGIAAILTDDGQPQEAARCFGMAAALRSSRRAFQPPPDRPRYERDLAAARASLSRSAFEASWQAGNALSPAESIAEALAISITGPRRRPTGELARQANSA